MLPCSVWQHIRGQAHVHSQPYERRVPDASCGCLLTARHALYSFLPQSSSLLGTKLNGLQLEPANGTASELGLMLWWHIHHSRHDSQALGRLAPNSYEE